MRNQRFSKAQSTAEYAILLAVLVATLIGMQMYLKRGIQGRVRDLADQISPTHYEPRETTSDFTTEQIGKSVQQYQNGTSITEIPENWTYTDASGQTRQVHGEETKRWGNERVEAE